jgi:uncharacterized protein
VINPARPEEEEAVDGRDLAGREARLRASLADLGSAVVAFSGGADSAYLAWVATDVLGDRVLCVTAESPSYPARHRELATRVAQRFGLRHQFIVTAEMENPAYRANEPDRCYHCKHELFTRLTALAREQGFGAVLDGANADDRGDYRPGRAAGREFGVISPLDAAELSKIQIRELSRRAGLPTWDEPASACLSSRIPYHSSVSAEKLRMIEQAEDVVHALGFRVCRVRHHDDLARIEVGPDDFARAVHGPARETMVRELKALGYRYVTLDLQGYRTGSLNEGIVLRPV